MKSVYLSFIACLCGFVLLVSISIIFQYTTTYKNLSFELRNALIQAGEKAMIPEEVCVNVECNEEEMEEPLFGCDVEGFREECEYVYMEEEEFFDILLYHLKRLKRSAGRVRVDLKAFHVNPFMAKVELETRLEDSFINTTIHVEEVCLEN